MKKLVCPHCNSHVSEHASVCVGCGAEIVRGATRRERANMGCAFALLAVPIGLVAIGSALPRNAKPDEGLPVFLGLLAFVLLAFFAGQAIARWLHRSSLRFLRSYEHR